MKKALRDMTLAELVEYDKNCDGYTGTEKCDKCPLQVWLSHTIICVPHMIRKNVRLDAELEVEASPHDEREYVVCDRHELSFYTVYRTWSSPVAAAVFMAGNLPSALEGRGDFSDYILENPDEPDEAKVYRNVKKTEELAYVIPLDRIMYHDKPLKKFLTERNMWEG